MYSTSLPYVSDFDLTTATSLAQVKEKQKAVSPVLLGFA
jgi:hypothetical protein